MYLHLGYGTVVPYEAVLGVFDLDNVSRQRTSRDFLERSQKTGTLRSLGDRLPLSLVVTDKESYLSPLSAAALAKRLAEDRWE